MPLYFLPVDKYQAIIIPANTLAAISTSSVLPMTSVANKTIADHVAALSILLLVLVLSSVTLIPFNYEKRPSTGMTVRELINQFAIDSVAFGLPLLYNQQLPDHNSQGHNGAMHHYIKITMRHRTAQTRLITALKPIPIGFKYSIQIKR